MSVNQIQGARISRMPIALQKSGHQRAFKVCKNGRDNKIAPCFLEYEYSVAVQSYNSCRKQPARPIAEMPGSTGGVPVHVRKVKTERKVKTL